MAGKSSEVHGQVNVNQVGGKGDAPAQENRGAPGGQAVRSPQDYEQDYERIPIKRGDIYVWDGRRGRKYRLRKESDVTVEVRSRRGIMLEYVGLHSYFRVMAKVVWIGMNRNYIQIHVKNDEQVDDDRVILRSYDHGKVDEITWGSVLAVMARYNISINIVYLGEECGGNACIEIDEAKNIKELGFYTMAKHIETKYI